MRKRCGRTKPNEPKFGWQQKASRALHKKFCQEVHLQRLTEPERALMRSQHGPLHHLLTAFSTHRMTKIDPQSSRVDLRRRLGLSLLLSSPADVAANLTLLATIAQRDPRQGFWEEGSLHLSALQRRFVAKREQE